MRGLWPRVAAVALCVLIVAGYRILYPATDRFLFLLYGSVIVFLLYTMLTATLRRDYPALPVATGRYCAIVPSYNEDGPMLLACIDSLLKQSIPPGRVYVVDDGSDPPVARFPHPLVTWIRQGNAGKREAQAAALRVEAEHNPAFVLTVDSDSVVERSAVENSLRPFSDPRVQAVTGLPMLLNYGANLLTRLVDLEIATSCYVGRASKSYLGVVSPASGAFAIYRAAVIYDNLDDYLASGKVGDDRRLAIYGLLRGQVVAVNDALVEVLMPTTLRASYRQRTRWFQAYWKYLPWEVAVLPNRPLFFRVWSLVFGICTPLLLLWMFLVVPLANQSFYWQGLVFWALIGYTQTLPYAVLRPGLSRVERWGAWLVLSPVIIIWQLAVIRPALFHALAVCRSERWRGRA